MQRVILESPYAGNREHHEAYLKFAIYDCLARGESPYASHRMLTEALDDTNPEDRLLGIEAGFAWHSVADKMVVYADHGISSGMKMAIEAATKSGLEIETRYLLLRGPYLTVRGPACE